jgi:hypothetical protein
MVGPGYLFIYLRTHVCQTSWERAAISEYSGCSALISVMAPHADFPSGLLFGSFSLTQLEEFASMEEASSDSNPLR